jgi:YD repeat-containing protein
MSRPVGAFAPAIQPAPMLAQTYTANGRVASLSDANGGNTTGFAYDGFDRLATTTWPGGSSEAFPTMPSTTC